VGGLVDSASVVTLQIFAHVIGQGVALHQFGIAGIILGVITEHVGIVKQFDDLIVGEGGEHHGSFADVISIEGQTVAVWAAGATLGTGTACRVHAPITVLTIANNMIAIDV